MTKHALLQRQSNVAENVMVRTVEPKAIGMRSRRARPVTNAFNHVRQSMRAGSFPDSRRRPGSSPNTARAEALA